MLRKALSCLILFVLYAQLSYAVSIKDESGVWFYILSEEDLTCVINSAPNKSHVTIASSYLYEGKRYKPVEIANMAFMDKDSVETVALPSTIERIGQSAFSGCTQLKEISLPSGLKSIGSYCFASCDSLSGFSAPAALTEIGSSAFSGSGVTHVEIGENIEEIGASAFSNCQSLQSFRMSPSPMKTINSGLFMDCIKLTGVELPNTITNIEDKVFSGCTSLTQIDLPDSLLRLGGDAFEDCINLSHVEMPSGITLGIGIQSYPFVKSIHFTQGARPVVDAVFHYSFPDLESISFAVGITEITGSAFSHCDSLESIEFSTSIRRIDGSAFYQCGRLEHVTLPPNLISIGSRAFTDCTGLKKVVLPVTLDTIGVSAFAYCSDLEEVAFPHGLKYIGSGAFDRCTSLKVVETDSELEYIGSDAFNHSGVQRLVLGRGLKTIGDRAFNYCPLTEIYSWNPQPPEIFFSTFAGGIYYDATLTVPAQAVEAYQSAEYWENFENIVGQDMSGVEQPARTDVSVSIQDGKLVVESDEIREIVVYDTQGRLVYRGTDTIVSVPRSGLYLVKVGTEVLKVML